MLSGEYLQRRRNTRSGSSRRDLARHVVTMTSRVLQTDPTWSGCRCWPATSSDLPGLALHRMQLCPLHPGIALVGHNDNWDVPAPIV